MVIVLKRLLFALLKKNKKVYDFSYKAYDFFMPWYLAFARRFSRKFSLERSVKRISDIQKGKRLPDMTFSKGVPYFTFKEVKFAYIPDSEGGYSYLFNDPVELTIEKTLASFLGRSSVFFDIGANFGFFSILLSKLVDNGKIFAFEPVPITFKKLKENVRLNNISDMVFPQNAAISDKDGHLYITTDKFGRNHITSERSRNAVHVETMTLDTFCTKHHVKRLDVVKCDVEGAEFMVLKGAEKVLSKYKPVLVLEVQENWMCRFGQKPLDLFDFLQGKGYSYKLITTRGVIPGSRYKDVNSDLRRTNNFLFIPRK